MKTIKIYCKKCGCKLTEELIEIPVSNLRWEDDTAIMEKNKYVDLNGNSQTFTMGANTTLSISGTKILSVPSSTLIITFLGAC